MQPLTPTQLTSYVTQTTIGQHARYLRILAGAELDITRCLGWMAAASPEKPLGESAALYAHYASALANIKEAIRDLQAVAPHEAAPFPQPTGILDMLERGIRKAWADEDWDRMVALTEQHRKVCESPASQAPTVNLSSETAHPATGLAKRVTVLENTLEAEAQHLDLHNRQLEDLERRLEEVEERLPQADELQRGAVALGGFDGRLLRIEKKLASLLEFLAKAQEGGQ